MYCRLAIKNFRGVDSLEVGGLRRINLIVSRPFPIALVSGDNERLKSRRMVPNVLESEKSKS